MKKNVLLLWTLLVCTSIYAQEQKFRIEYKMHGVEEGEEFFFHEEMEEEISLVHEKYHFDVVTHNQKDKVSITSNHKRLNKFWVLCGKGDIKYKDKKAGKILDLSVIESNTFTVVTKTPEGIWIARDFDK